VISKFEIIIKALDEKDLVKRHGALLAISSIILGLSGNSNIITERHFNEYKRLKYKVESVEALSLICSDYRKE